MKLKLTADPKKWAIFAVFCVIALYIVAVAVLNLSYFANFGTAWGLNPIPAFGPDYILATIFGFIAVLIASFVGVSSYFFEKTKGIGISTAKKEEKGYSRWCEDKEMKKAAGIVVIKPTDDNIEKGGIPIYNDGKEVWVDTNTYHNMIIGSTGSGKSQGLSFPYINVMAKAGESMIITDPKGELYMGTAKELEKRGYNIILLNFRDPDHGNCWNPFTVPYKLYQAGNIDKSIELLEDLAKNILYDEGSKADPFWNNTSADYFAGLAWALFQDAKEEEVNINSINYMATVGEQRIGPTNYMKEYFSTKSPTSTESIKVNSTITAPNETKGSILSVFNQKIQLFSSRETLSEMLSRSDFDMEDIGRKKTAVFIVVQDEKKTYHPLVTIFLKQCYETLIRVAQEESGGKLKYRTNFLMDEFANMPPLSDVDAMVSAARSRNIRLSFIIQNFSQLNDVYGKEKAETIRGNCSNTIYLLSTELAALEEISKMCGEVKAKKDDKEATKPLITVTDLQNMKEEEALILRSRMRPFKTKLKYDHKIEWGMSKEKAEFPTREKKTVQLFDLKKYVDVKREENMNNLLKGLGPSADPTRPNPFDPSRPNPFEPSRPAMPENRQPNKNIEEFLKQFDERLEKASADKKTVEQPKPVEPVKPSDGNLTEDEKQSIRDTVKAALAAEKPKAPKVEVKPKEEKVSKPTEDEVVKNVTLEVPTPSININQEKEAKIKEYEELQKNKEEELKKIIATTKEPETKDTYETSEEARHQITEDEFFDDFFNDDY